MNLVAAAAAALLLSGSALEMLTIIQHDAGGRTWNKRNVRGCLW